MGWCSGSTLFGKIIEAAIEEIPDDENRKRFYLKAIEAFEDEDWDTHDECLGEDDAFDAALKELHPDW